MQSRSPSLTSPYFPLQGSQGLLSASGTAAQHQGLGDPASAVVQPELAPVPALEADLDFGGGDMFSGLSLADPGSAEPEPAVQLPPASPHAAARSTEAAAQGVAGWGLHAPQPVVHFWQCTVLHMQPCSFDAGAPAWCSLLPGWCRSAPGACMCSELGSWFQDCNMACVFSCCVSDAAAVLFQRTYSVAWMTWQPPPPPLLRPVLQHITLWKQILPF